jgi:AraC-like DNA-binding protein
MAPLLRLPSLLAALGVDPDEVIRAGGADPAAFDDPDKTLPFPVMGRLLDHCARATGCLHLGLELGRHSGLDALGTLGEIAQTAPDLGSALRFFILHLHLHDRGAVPLLWERGDQAMLGYVIHWPDVAGTEQIYDAAVAIIHNILKSLTGPGWQPDAVWLHCPLPEDRTPYRNHFQTRLHFAAQYAAVGFRAKDLSRPLPGSDARAYAGGLREVEALEAFRDGGLHERIQRVLRRLLIAGTPASELRLEPVAALFGLHGRTLNRRLHAEGTSFKALLDETRYRIACQLLRDTQLPMQELAITLGYADVTAFTRAFHRWSGASPAAWRSARRRDAFTFTPPKDAQKLEAHELVGLDELPPDAATGDDQ